jgi:IrrE N-terminal-like domain
VRKLREETGARDPVATIEHKARDIALAAIEEGWTGPPYDPFELADSLGIELVAREDLDDARLVSFGGHPRIEFNPARSAARARFSIAHEIGHFLFPDYADRPRYRDLARQRRDDWQLEVLCNIAAAELIMPIGSFPIAETQDLSLPHLLDHRARFGVSTEALLRRTVKLTDRPTCLFAAARLTRSPGFRLDYLVPSRSWAPDLNRGQTLPATSVLSRCTAVGFSDDAVESWDAEQLRVQAVGVPPYSGDSFPRVVGLLEPAEEPVVQQIGLRYVRGDAAEPRTEGPAIIAHVVNDRARRWGGHGFVRSVTDHFHGAAEAYAEWAASGPLQRGAVHLQEIGPDLWLASLVAQAGYGDTTPTRPRLRLFALREALATLATMALDRAADVHIPPIGTGQAGGRWPEIRDLILEELADRHVVTTVYVLPGASMPEDALIDEQLTLT